MKNGFNISTGWNLGKKKISNHLLEPFTSIPKKGTNSKVKKVKKNNVKETLIKISWSKKEKAIKRIIPNEIYIKCFKKK